VLAALACSGSTPPGERSQAVAGGEPTGERRAGVLYVTAEVGTFSGNPVVKAGSGSLLAPNLLVTALHVVSHNPSNVPFTCDATGNEVSGSKGSELGTTVAAEKVAVFAGPEPGGEPLARGQRIVSSGSTTICQNDIAFIVLDRALDLMTMPVLRGAPVAVGDELVVIGFGGDDLEAPPLRTERSVNVTDVGQWIRTFTVSAGPCEGDSGGPALTQAGELAGVFSTVSLNCTSDSAAAKYTDMSYFTPLVEDAFVAADAGAPWPNGSGGEAGALGIEPTTAGEPAVSSPPPTNTDTGCAIASAGAPVGRWWMAIVALGLLARHVSRCKKAARCTSCARKLRNSCR
jgi:hypothetical protein